VESGLHKTQIAVSSDRKRSTAIAMAETWESPKILREKVSHFHRWLVFSQVNLIRPIETLQLVPDHERAYHAVIREGRSVV
jgi:hypothetical protein